MVNVFRLVEVHRYGVTQRWQAELDDLRARLVLATDRAAGCVEALEVARHDLARQHASTARQEPVRAEPVRAEPARAEPARAEPAQQAPAVAGELVALADRMVDLTGAAAPTDAAQAVEVLGWLRRRVDALLAVCEVTRVTDDGPVDGLRHEVVAARPAPRPELVDHIADTVRPGYRWRADLLRAQQVVTYVAVHD